MSERFLKKVLVLRTDVKIMPDHFQGVRRHSTFEQYQRFRLDRIKDLEKEETEKSKQNQRECEIVGATLRALGTRYPILPNDIRQKLDKELINIKVNLNLNKDEAQTNPLDLT